MNPSFYKVIKPFLRTWEEKEYLFLKGRVLLFNTVAHSRVVIVANASSQTVYVNGFSSWDNGFRNSLVDAGFIAPITSAELKKIYPHLTPRIKRNVADYELKPGKPVLMCLDCGKRNNPRFDKNARPMVLKTDKCPLCKEIKPLSFTHLFGIHRLEGFK